MVYSLGFYNLCHYHSATLAFYNPCLYHSATIAFYSPRLYHLVTIACLSASLSLWQTPKITISGKKGLLWLTVSEAEVNVRVGRMFLDQEWGRIPWKRARWNEDAYFMPSRTPKRGTGRGWDKITFKDTRRWPSSLNHVLSPTTFWLCHQILKISMDEPIILVRVLMTQSSPN